MYFFICRNDVDFKDEKETRKIFILDSRSRSRTSELIYAVTEKNKLYKPYSDILIELDSLYKDTPHTFDKNLQINISK